MANKTYIGIDPGSKGFIAVMHPDGTREYCSLQDCDYHDIAIFLKNIKTLCEESCVCCMEEIHAIFGSSAKSTFSFGKTFGVLQGLLIALEIP